MTEERIAALEARLKALEATLEQWEPRWAQLAIDARRAAQRPRPTAENADGEKTLREAIAELRAEVAARIAEGFGCDLPLRFVRDRINEMLTMTG